MLYSHSGITGSLKKFTAKLRRIEQDDPLPEYAIAVNRDPENTSVTLFRKTANMPRTRRGVFGSAQAVAQHAEISGSEGPQTLPPLAIDSCYRRPVARLKAPLPAADSCFRGPPVERRRGDARRLVFSGACPHVLSQL